MRYLGEFSTTQTVRFLWNTNAGGPSVTRATNGSIRVYKNNSATQRTSSSGITDTEDFDGLTGVHLCSVDLSDNADSGFYVIGRYQVVLESATIDGATVHAVLAHFDITIAGGGGGGGGTNPPVAAVPTDIPLLFTQIRTVGGTNYYFAHGTQLSDASAYYGGRKPGKLLSVSSHQRGLSRNGDFDSQHFTLRLADTDRQFKILVASGSLRGAYVAVYLVDDAVRRAEGEAFRLMAGLVVNHRAGPNATYELECADVLARLLEDIGQQPMIPPVLLTGTSIPGLDSSMEGKPAQIVCGYVSDRSTATNPPNVNLNPQGVVPPQYLGGPINLLTMFGGANIDVRVWVWSQGAIPTSGIEDVFFNDFTDPDDRDPVPASAWGSLAFTPGKPGWSATGITTDYIDYNGIRLTPLFIVESQAAAIQAILEGRMLIAGNMYGSPTNGDGSGGYISSPAFLWQHILVNWVFNRYLTGSYPSIPSLDGTYSVIDTTSVSTANTKQIARVGSPGYVSGFILGARGQQQSAFDVLGELCKGSDMDQGINRHGQLMLSVEDTSEAAIHTVNAQRDIEDGSYEVWTAGDELINRVEQQFAYFYVPPSAPAATPPEGEPVPTNPLEDQPLWDSGLKITEDTAAQTAIGGEIRTLTIDNYVTRIYTTANDVATKMLARGLGPQDDGPRMCRFSGGWSLLGLGSVNVDLGSVINVLHPMRVGASETGTDKCRVLAIEVEPTRHRVTLTCRIIG